MTNYTYFFRHGIKKHSHNDDISVCIRKEETKNILKSQFNKHGLKKVRVDHLYSSNLVRAKQTADIFCDMYNHTSDHKIRIKIEPGLSEILATGSLSLDRFNYYDNTNVLNRNIDKSYKPYHVKTIPKMESRDRITRRIHKLFDHHLRKDILSRQNTVIITHGHVFGYMMKHLDKKNQYTHVHISECLLHRYNWELECFDIINGENVVV